MKRIAVLMPKWIGDYVMALSMVEEKRRVHKDEISLITAPYLVDLAKSLTTMDIIPYKSEESLAETKSRNFSDIYIIPHSISSALWAFSTGIKNRHGYKKEGRSPLLTVRHTRSNPDRTKHITSEYADLLEIQHPDISAVPGANLRTEESDTIIICPGAKYGPAKQWPHYSYLIESLPNEKFAILGGKDEWAYANVLIKENPSANIQNLCGTGTLAEAAQHLANAKVVISNDSGLMHLAAYVKAPVIGIFGSSTPTWTRPVGSSSKVIWHNEPCSPCFERECRYGHYNCLDKIGVTEVLSLIDELI